jgi:hypothetical protein
MTKIKWLRRVVTLKHLSKEMGKASEVSYPLMLSAVCGLLSAVCCLLSAGCWLLAVVCCLLSDIISANL